MSTTLMVKNARLSFDKNLFVPTEAKGKKPGKYSCNIIASPETTFAVFANGKSTPVAPEDLIKLIEAELKAKFTKVPAKYENWAIRKNVDSVSAQTGERFSGYEDDDGFYFSPSRYADQNPPAYVRGDMTQIDISKPGGLEEVQRTFYAGCYANFKINLSAFEVKEDNVTKRGITSFLEGIQFLRKGDRFGRGEASVDGFSEEKTDDADDGLDEI